MPTDINSLLTMLPISPAVYGAVAVLISLFIKPILEQTILPVSAPLHDVIIRLISVLLGIALSFAYIIGTGGKVDTVSTVVTGFSSGLAAIGLFHTVSGFTSASGTNVVSTTPTAPTTKTTEEQTLSKQLPPAKGE